MVDMTRIMVFDRLDNYLFDIEPKQVMDAPYIEEINREHSLTITTFQGLEKTNRLLICDGMGIWHEYVVLGASETHESAIGVVRDYYCIWSLQYDLMCTFINNQYGCGIVPGHASIPQSAATAMGVALGGTSRWTVGTITVTTMAAASFYRQSGWEGLQTVIEKWGGEIQATITVDSSGVVSRTVDLLTHIGNSQATRRFDFTHDVTKIKRTVSDDVWPCRIVPLGKSQETEAGGYTRRPDISSVNDGCMWLQDDEVVPYTYTTNPDGEYEYPIIIVENDTYEQPSDLKAWAIARISDYTRPKVTYEASVLQFAKAGLNPHGVALGDNVVVVDRTFGSDGLRINARVTKIAGNLLDSSDTKLTIGNISESLTNQLAGISRQVAQVSEVVSSSQQFQASAEYLSNLINRLNTGINATGGYVYITEGEGLLTFDNPVSDPLVGSEATKVVEVKGGNIRIADSRTASGDWNWKTLISSGHIAAELVTAVRAIAGFIGNAGGSYWDLDNNEFVIATGANLGDRTVQQVLDGVDATVTGVRIEYAKSTSQTTAPDSGWSTAQPTWESGKYIWTRTATTTGTGTSASTSYSTPVMISGKDGVDGQNGNDGIGISSTTINYGTSASGSTQPQSWQTSIPSVSKGQWLWVKTEYVYSNSSTKTVYTKSYVGTDGEDGKSVYVQSSSKSGGTTTVVIADSDGNTHTLSIVDGTDGTNGTPGTNGLNSYVHFAWANSSDGETDFSRTDSAGKTYIGVYTDNTQADSTSPSDYNWSLIKGADGADGTNGYNTATIMLYQRAASQPSKPSSSLTYTFATHELSGTLGSWSTSVPSGTDPCWVTAATATSTTATDTIASSEWTTPIKLVQNGTNGTNGTNGINGTNGTDGLNQATIYLYQRAASQPSVPSGSLTYTFSGGSLSGTLGSWSRSVPASNGNPCWVTTAVAIANTATDTIASSDWATPTKLVEDGADGTNGDDGVGITLIVPQYYLSTSNSTQTGGSWSSNEPTWESGKYIWTRSLITWDTTPASTTTTTPVLANALNGANSTAKSAKDTADAASSAAADAAKVATNYLTFSSSTGLDVGYSGTNAKTRVNANGMEVFDGNGNSSSFFGLNSGYSIARVGLASSSNVVLSSAGFISLRYYNTILAYFGYGEGLDEYGNTVVAPYYSVGVRKANTAIGNYCIAEGYNNESSNYCSHAEGYGNVASGIGSHAEGHETIATGRCAHAEGTGHTTGSGGAVYGATGDYSHSEGEGNRASGNCSHAEGKYSTASGASSHSEGSATASGYESHAEGSSTASGRMSHAEGAACTASGDYSHASGYYTTADADNMTAVGSLNTTGSTGRLFVVGKGTKNGSIIHHNDAFYVNDSGNIWCSGTLTQNSDRRLKEHHKYLDEDACEFIRNLKPALFTKDGERHTGFYAQDVQDVEPDGWGTVTVEARHTDDELDFDPLTLDYTALIAPLTAYAQQLEHRIEQLEKQLRGGER